MTTREKIAHLLRRFGLGASPGELDLLTPLGVAGAVDWLIDYEKQDEGFGVSPWRFCFEEGKDEAYFDSFRPASWWAARLYLTRRPLQERMTLFWHDYFAVSGSKVEFGPMMLAYQQKLRQHATGDFRTLLLAMARDPAMLLWLDTTANLKGRANENFARELMELFTLGIGGYTERDIQEAARAFTGWGIRFLVLEPGLGKLQETATEFMRENRPMFAYAFSPELHDDGEKTVLGKTGRWSGENVIDIVLAHPDTARRIVTKLWSYLAYPSPEPELVGRLARGFQDSGLKLKPLLRAIATSPEFWSDRCVRQKIKDPVDFTVPLIRQFGVDAFFEPWRQDGPASPASPAPKPLRDVAGLVLGAMMQQGMLLNFPPDVGGWPKGKAWVSSTLMMQRTRFADLIFGLEEGEKFLAPVLVQRMRAANRGRTSRDVVAWFTEAFDASLPATKTRLLVEAFDATGGVAALDSTDRASVALAAVARTLFASPEFNVC